MNAKRCQCPATPAWFRATWGENEFDAEHDPSQTLVSCYSCHGMARVKARHTPEQEKLPATSGDISNVRDYLDWLEKRIKEDEAEDERYVTWNAMW